MKHSSVANPVYYSRKRNTVRVRGFSLVETTLALGVIAFAFVAVFSILPIGLQTFQDASSKLQTSFIAQKLLAEAQQTPFALTPQLFGKVRYYDAEGQELSVAEGASSPGTAAFVYSAILLPASDQVNESNWQNVGLSRTHTRIIKVRIAKNRNVERLAEQETPLAEYTFALGDVRL